MLNRLTLQELANIRFDEAKFLLDNGRYDGAYYLSGYVIELALKACIAKRIKEHDFPDKDIVKNSYTHQLSTLFNTALLWDLFEQDLKKNKQLELNWSIVKDWKEDSRYEKHSKQKAEDMFSAVSDANTGVFEWVKQYW